MIDDSLSDTQPIVTQEEKKMSVKKLEFKWQGKDMTIGLSEKGIEVWIRGDNIEWIELDRNQAHLLMLYLQEHLS